MSTLTPAPGVERPRPAHRLVSTFTLAILVGVVAVAFESFGTLTAMPAAAEELGGIEFYAWAFTAFLLAQVLAIVLAGRWCDRAGAVPALSVGAGVFVLGLLGAGLAGSMPELLAMRFLQGLGGGAVGLALMVLVAQVFDHTTRANLMSIFSFCWVLPSFLGPPLAAWITERLGWHWVFWAVIPVMLGAAALGAGPMLRVHREWTPPAGLPAGVPIWAALLAALGAALLQLAGQRLTWLSVPTALAALAVLVVALHRIGPADYLRFGRGLPATMGVRGLQAGVFFATQSFIPLLLVQQHGLSLTQAGYVITVGSAGWTLCSVLQARRWLRIRRDQVIILGCGLTLVGVLAMATAVWLNWPVPALAGAFVVMGAGMGFTVASTSLVTMQLSSTELLGANTSALQVSEGVGNSLITGLAGTIFASLHLHAEVRITFAVLHTMVIVFALLGLLASTRIGPVRNESSGVG